MREYDDYDKVREELIKAVKEVNERSKIFVKRRVGRIEDKYVEEFDEILDRIMDKFYISEAQAFYLGIVVGSCLKRR